MNNSQNQPPVACPLCLENTVLRSFNWGNQPIIRCLHCGLDYCPSITYKEPGADTSPTTKENITMLMDTFIASQPVAFQRINNRLLEFQQFKSGNIQDVLEIGCGPGIFHAPFAAAGISWTGLEVNPRWIQWGREQQIPIKNNPISDYKESFDLIIACQLLEHFSEPRLFITNLLRAIRPGGLLHLEVPNHNSFMSALRKISPRLSPEYGCIQPTRHMRAYSVKSFEYIFSEFDLQTKHLVVYPNDHPVWGQARVKQPLINRLTYRVSDMLGSGSLLVGIAQKT
ncbi:MAG TPA: class I SAM-dependent methyltransferase [Candidatus Marinimicrobia bacterium]|jgi:2-polyprenyl-3-methyl-5-hydroxy-6-metoxy-1,4-benzoquinol methylase|nr:class I SAM-dependent methyltransferase [Candidatus Neomarinimicrobiota bacterium]